jgi:hypothetical protein
MKAIPLKKTRRDYERVLTAVFGLLIQCGVRERVVSAITNRALKVAIRKANSLGQSSGGELSTFSLVLDAWHRDRRYLTARGKPRAVPLLGRAPSVEGLIRSEGPMFDPIDLAYRIQSLGLITACPGNRYRPIGDTALVAIYGPTVLQHVARCLMSLLETVEDNLTGAPTSAHLLERFAEVPDLPAECVDDFQQFSRLQGAMFARTINDWLETRRARDQATVNRANAGAVRAGVHVHAYVAPMRSRMRTSVGARRPTV